MKWVTFGAHGNFFETKWKNWPEIWHGDVFWPLQQLIRICCLAECIGGMILAMVFWFLSFWSSLLPCLSDWTLAATEFCSYKIFRSTCYILIQILLKHVSLGLIDNKSTSFGVIIWSNSKKTNLLNKFGVIYFASQGFSELRNWSIPSIKSFIIHGCEHGIIVMELAYM